MTPGRCRIVPPLSAPRRTPSSYFWGDLESQWQREGDPRAAFRPVLGPDSPALRLHEPFCDRQAQAGAAARARARIVVAPEPLEHPLGRTGSEPLAIVLDCDHHVVGVRLDDD